MKLLLLLLAAPAAALSLLQKGDSISLSPWLTSSSVLLQASNELQQQQPRQQLTPFSFLGPRKGIRINVRPLSPRLRANAAQQQQQEQQQQQRRQRFGEMYGRLRDRSPATGFMGRVLRRSPFKYLQPPVSPPAAAGNAAAAAAAAALGRPLPPAAAAAAQQPVRQYIPQQQQQQRMLRQAPAAAAPPVEQQQQQPQQQQQQPEQPGESPRLGDLGLGALRLSSGETAGTTPSATAAATGAAPAAKRAAAGDFGLPEPVPAPAAEEQQQQQTRLQRETVAVMKYNLNVKEQDKDKTETRQQQQQQHPVESVARDALIAMSGEDPSKKEIIINNIRDPLSGKQLLQRCRLTELRILGVGGTGIVLAVGVVAAADAAVLNTKELALKLMFNHIPGLQKQQQHLQQLQQQQQQQQQAQLLQQERQELLKAVGASLTDLLVQELEPLQGIGAGAAGAGEGAEEAAAVLAAATAAAARRRRQPPSARSVAAANQWALPLYEATVGPPEAATAGEAEGEEAAAGAAGEGIGEAAGSVYAYKDFVFLQRVLLSEVMLGDATLLLYQSPYAAATAKLSLEGKAFACKQLIDAAAKLHAAGICHFDIKPENLLINKEGKTYLADFGMTSRTGEKRKCNEKYTPFYMDPAHASCVLRQQQHRGAAAASTEAAVAAATANPAYDAWSVGFTCFLLFVDGAAAPYKLHSSKQLTPFLANLDVDNNPRTSAAILQSLPSPASQLAAAGVSPFWCQVVGSLLNPSRKERITPLQLVRKYKYWPLQ
ncbi:Rhoptry kinase family protein ROP25, putative [Eimeria acervulina]|uniref:Rhoptry kinase family protein ROP25, putative n=1 Tax=Eimeria acervulina TaxID=5801 RepID=U6GG59_EIMAC|nr:Rhoptry kinase family protein ROP25, putative [Eimeria acervulina]CDI77564.1 Rhoptry kinase family protein ROP25, putative [Eimeria acervulina]